MTAEPTVGLSRTFHGSVTLGALSRPAGNSSQLDFDEAEIAAVESLRMELLKKRSIRVLENHAQADHAGS